MAPARSLGPLLLAALATFGVAVFVFGAGAAGTFMLAVVMNGMTERAAAPVFIVWLLLVCGGNLALGTLVGGHLLRRWEPTAKRWGIGALMAGGLSALVLLFGLAAFLG